jgi:SAM-dependent methyltransferase
LRRRALDAPIEVEVRDMSLADLASSGQTFETTVFDTVVSVLQLSREDDLVAALRAVRARLAPDGRLLFLEPTVERGFTGRVQQLLGPTTRLTSGRRPDRDFTGSARAAGLVVTDCERLTMPTLWPFRAFAEGVARVPLLERA